MDFRQEYRKKYPDKDITLELFYSNHGVSKYHATWVGEWSEKDLVNYADNGIAIYGGRIDDYADNGGVKSGVVCVYYD